MYKQIIILISISIFFVGSGFANDCDLVAGNFDGAIQIYKNLKYEKTIPEDAFKKALIHLKAHCCTKTLIPCTPEEKKELPQEKLYPASPYLFDHLIDITMRRLDGISNLVYDIEPDKAGKARREEITNMANNPTGESAKAIQETYEKYRKINLNNTKDINVVAKKYSNENNPDTLSLGDKYNKLCDLMKMIYENIQNEKRIVIGGDLNKKSFLNSCKNMVNTRVKRETAYVKLIMSKQSNQLLNETTQAYTKKHFIEEKLMGLWTLISKVKELFQTIVQQAAVSKTCNK